MDRSTTRSAAPSVLKWSMVASTKPMSGNQRGGASGKMMWIATTGKQTQDLRAEMREGKLTTGEDYVADAEYIRESIRNPEAKKSEGFGNAVIEAQAMQLPVVCTDAGGLPENIAAILGVGAAVLFGMLKPAIYARDELERMTQRPVLGTVTRFRIRATTITD